MAKVSFTNLKIKTKTDVKTFKIGETEVEVLQYLPIKDKYDLIMSALQGAEEDGYYNALKVDMLFHLYIVYLYTNITFTDKQKEDETKLYDILASNGVINSVIENMDENEYTYLVNYIDTIQNDKVEYNISNKAVMDKLIDDLPKNAEAAMQIVNSFDKEKYAEVVSFAKSANGGRPIK